MEKGSHLASSSMETHLPDVVEPARRYIPETWSQVNHLGASIEPSILHQQRLLCPLFVTENELPILETGFAELLRNTTFHSQVPSMSVTLVRLNQNKTLPPADAAEKKITCSSRQGCLRCAERHPVLHALPRCPYALSPAVAQKHFRGVLNAALSLHHKRTLLT